MLPKKILLICSGNICRSPFAECYLKGLASGSDFEIASAGLIVDKSGLNGCEVPEIASKVAKEFAIDLTKHRAKQLTEEMLKQNEIILTMNHSQLSRLKLLFPNWAHKYFIIGEWSRYFDIDDPFGKDEDCYSLCYKKIKISLDLWLQKLSNNK